MTPSDPSRLAANVEAQAAEMLVAAETPYNAVGRCYLREGAALLRDLLTEVARLQAERDEAETARDKARSTRDHWHAQLQIAEAARDEAQREKRSYARKIAIDCGADELEVDQAIEQS